MTDNGMHEIGDEITVGDQLFYLMGIESRRATAVAPAMQVEVWQSTCICGEPYLVETPRFRRLRERDRRCPKHRGPWQPVVLQAGGD